MPRNRKQRRHDDLLAAEVLAKHVEPIMEIVAQSIDDLQTGHAALDACIRDTRLIMDIARRLDDAIPTPEPVETWDRLLWVLVAGLALGIYRVAREAANPRHKAKRLATKALDRAAARACDDNAT